MTVDRWEEVNHLTKFQLPSSYGLGVTGDMRHLKCDSGHLTCYTYTQLVVNIFRSEHSLFEGYLKPYNKVEGDSGMVLYGDIKVL